ncbi:DUF6115 domain-containing protein [Oceanobacillus sp. FSL W7-1309]|uniref:DUF6115 domain-containing protein n=1 Tax=Oceanobacillus sp. FSL W7-1309 TaxID=2954539 RepID=UPI0030F989D1
MVSFLIIISFLLHFITFIAIYMFFKQLQNVKTQDLNEVIALFDTYLQEVKAENNRLQQLLEDRNKKTDQTHTKQEEPETEEYEKSHDIPIPDDVGDTVVASLESRVLQLHNRGVPVDEIAKELNCGKTEAEIIIKLHEKMQ